MTVERLTQKIKLGDKYLIQDSMRKLINMIAENRRNQEEIIKFLPENEIIKIMSYMEDPDPTFRKLTAKFLLELVYSNYIVQQIFCNILGILPWDGKVCINLIPESFRRSNKALPDCLEILKRNFPEEMKESLPFCWYFAPEDADESESPVKFLTQIDKKELEGADVFVDPLYAMVGFIVRTPKVKRSSGKSPECAERPLTASIELDPKKSLISNNSKVLKSVNSTTSTLNQTVQARSRKNSAIIDKGNFKSVSPSRNLASNIVVVSSTIGYPKKSAKARAETTGSSSICNSERMMQNKIGIVTEISDESNRESVNLGAHYLPGFKKYIDLKEKVPRNRESTLSNETYDVHNVKMGTSHNESNDHGSKLLETSVSNSLSMKGSFAVGLNERNSNLSSYKSANEKKIELAKKTAEKPITIEKTTERAKLKPKPMIEVDQKPDPKAASFKGLRDNGGLSLSYSAATTPKNNLLGKFLKEKPAVKENLYSSKQQLKTKVDNTKKLNSTATSLTGKHVPQKSSIGGGQKTKLLNKTETEYLNKKYGLNPSLMKSIDLNDRSHGITLADRPQSCKNNTAKTKIYNISSVLKSTISTPRTPTENLKAAFGLNSKILNARKSQDVIYQTSIPRDKRRSEALVSFQNIKTKQFDIQETV